MRTPGPLDGHRPAGSLARPLKVVLVINSLGGGGAERSLAELLPRYKPAGIDPVVVCLKRRDEGVERDVRRSSIPLVYLTGRNALSWVGQLAGLARATPADLIHTSIFEADLVGRFAGLRTGIPVLTSLVNTSYESIRLLDPNVSRFGMGIARVLDGWTARTMTTHFHAISDTVKRASVRALGISPDRITVVERGRDLVRLGEPSHERRARARRSLGIDAADVVLVNTGRQEYQKGQRYLLEAMAALVPRHPRLVLLVAGRPGNATQELRALSDRLKLEGKVRFLGYREDVPEILAAADLFVFPSLFEGAGGALIEAMAMGLPIVASDIPSTREVAGESALLVHVASAEALAEGIENLLGEPCKARALGMQASAIFRSRFTLDSSATRMVDLYRRVVAAGRRGISFEGRAR